MQTYLYDSGYLINSTTIARALSLRTTACNLGMAKKVRTAGEWKASREVTRAWADKVRRAVGPVVRTKPRNADEARVLREGGTPERLIGPSKDPE